MAQTAAKHTETPDAAQLPGRGRIYETGLFATPASSAPGLGSRFGSMTPNVRSNLNGACGHTVV
jgi:hypothetical protein